MMDYRSKGGIPEEICTREEICKWKRGDRREERGDTPQEER
jgi:hypothetical protein